MRTAFASDMDEHALDSELLSTGEAASLLGTSRQHVVDLCKAGDVQFVLVGSHRRIPRLEVERILERNRRLTRDQVRSLLLAHAVAGHLVREPESTLARARENLGKMLARASRGAASVWLNEWDHLLDGPLLDILTALTAQSPRSRELRQNSPFAGVLSEAERAEVLATAARMGQRR